MTPDYGDVPELVALEKLYILYDDVIKDIPIACRKGCSVCCTCNVSLTSLEGRYLLRSLSPGQVHTLLARMEPLRETPKFCPGLTINGYAALCLSGGQPPEEENNPSWGACPLLTCDLCPVYGARPFGCRCLVSEETCSDLEPARVPPYILTVNTVFMQVIENLDARGFSGNLSDMIPALVRDPLNPGSGSGLIQNRKSGMLMVPPEHRSRLEPLLRAMSRACAQPKY
ncbi:MAG: hypothetical protein V1793_16510 [Pseudomonadota bacterium]